MKTGSRSLLLKIERKNHIKILIQVITQVLIARLLSNFIYVLIIVEGKPLLFLGV